MRIVFVAALLASALAFHPGAVKAATAEDFQREYSAYQEEKTRGLWLDALQSLIAARDIAVEIGESDHVLGDLAIEIGGMAVGVRQWDLALPSFLEGIEILERNRGEVFEENVSLHLMVARVYRKKSEFENARKALDKASRVSRELGSRTSWTDVEILIEQGHIRSSEPRSGTPLKYYREALNLSDSTFGRVSESSARARLGIANFHAAIGSYKQAVEELLEALAIFEAVVEPTHADIMFIHAQLIEVYERMDRGDDATKHCIALGKLAPEATNGEPQPIYRVAPHYPKSYRKIARQGYVDVQFTITKEGRVLKPKVITASKEGFVKPTMEAIQKWRFKPLIIDGEAVDRPGAEVRIRFKIAS